MKHLVLILDDTGYAGMSPFAHLLPDYVGDVIKQANTPVFQAQADAGVLFERGYMNAVCGPTRTTFYTGRHGFRSGIGTNVFITDETGPDENDPWLPRQLTSHACGVFGKWHLVSNNNGAANAPLASAQFDKHWGTQGNLVSNAGEDYFNWFSLVDGVLGTVGSPLGTAVAGTTHDHSADTFTRASGSWLDDGVVVGTTFSCSGWSGANLNGNQFTVSAVTATEITYTPSVAATETGGTVTLNKTRAADNYSTTKIFDEAQTWIQAQSGDWLAVVCMHAGHTPYTQPPTGAERTTAGLPSIYPATGSLEAIVQAFSDSNEAFLEANGWGASDVTALRRDFLATFLASIQAVDTEFGRFLTALEGSGDVDLDPTTGDTQLWIFADNGPTFDIIETPPQDGSHAKGTMYELSVRCPMIVRGRGVTAQGETCPRLIQPVDIYRTILATEGIDPTTLYPSLEFDGLDMTPFFSDPKGEPIRTHAYVENFAPNGPITSVSQTLTQWTRAIVSEQWKLLTLQPSGPGNGVTYELYNVGGGDWEETYNFLPGNALTRTACNQIPEVFAGLQSLIAAESALLPS